MRLSFSLLSFWLLSASTNAADKGLRGTVQSPLEDLETLIDHRDLQGGPGPVAQEIGIIATAVSCRV